MSRPASSQGAGRRRKHGPGPRRLQGWDAEEEDWACPPSPRRGRWERPGPADWGPQEPPSETEAGPGPSPPRASWNRKQPPIASWRGRPRNRHTGEPWGRADSQKSWGGPPSDDGGSLEQPRRQRVPRPGGGGRWSSPERTGGGRRRSPSPGQGLWWDSTEALSRKQGPNGDTRAWGSPGREASWERSRERSRSIERPVWEQRQASPPGPEGRWASAGRRKEEIQSPNRVQRNFGSSGRGNRQGCRGSISSWSQASKEQAVDSFDETAGRWGRTEWRGRDHHSPTRKQSSWGTPKGEARQERSGSSRHHAREQSQENPDEAGSRWSSAWCRKRSNQNCSRDEGSSDSFKRKWQSPNGEARGQGSPIRSRGAENPDGGGAGDSQERRGEEKRTCSAGSSSPKAASDLITDLISGTLAVPKEWKPRESVVQWWMECQSALSKKQRDQLISICPRPTLPDSLSETPQVNPDILSLLIKKEERELRSAIHFTLLLQDEVLDTLAPAMTIYEMAEEAMEKGEPVDPMELREWSRHLLRFLGSMNNRLTFKHRSQVLGSINPRLKLVVSKMSSQNADGMLFAADKVKLLKEIIMRFPQLTETKRKIPGVNFHSFTQVASRRRARRRGGSRLMGTGKLGTANLRVKQSRSPGAGGQGPAEGPSDA